MCNNNKLGLSVKLLILQRNMKKLQYFHTKPTFILQLTFLIVSLIQALDVKTMLTGLMNFDLVRDFELTSLISYFIYALTCQEPLPRLIIRQSVTSQKIC